MIKKTVIAFFIILIISFLSTPYYYRPAHAILGIADTSIVNDPIHTASNANNWIQNFINRAIDMAFRAILNNLKKRVLDSILDDTTAWIRGDSDGAPKFVTEPGKFLKDAADAAVGDTLVQIGAGQLCRGVVPPIERIQIKLAKPVFSQKISCTLSQVIDNVGAFADNFEVGGLIGYQELLKPQNNRWGNEILIRDELERHQATKTETTKQEATLSAGTGSLGLKECVEWQLIHKDSKELVPAGGPPATIVVEDNPLLPGSRYFTPRAPDDPPPLTEHDLAKNGGVHIDNVPNIERVLEWHCNKDRTTTPGAIIGEGIKGTIGDDKGLILNSDDIATIAAALIDAAITRVIKEGVAGFQAMTKSQTTTGGPPARDLNDPSIPPSVREAIRQGASSTQDLIDNARQPLLRVINDAISALTEANNLLTNASTSLNASTTNVYTAGLLQILNVIANRTPPGCSQVTIDWANSELSTASTFPQAITDAFARISPLSNQITRMRTAIQNARSLSELNQIDTSNLTALRDQATQLALEARNIYTSITNKLTEARGRFNAECLPPFP